MRNLARRLVVAEKRPGGSADTRGRAAFRVCDKLRESLSALAGTRGFGTLMERALARAKVEVPWLGNLEVRADGLLVIPAPLEHEKESKEAARGGVALVTHLLELLSTFIGEALTLRLVQQIWPKAVVGDPKSGGKK